MPDGVNAKGQLVIILLNIFAAVCSVSSVRIRGLFRLSSALQRHHQMNKVKTGITIPQM